MISNIGQECSGGKSNDWSQHSKSQRSERTEYGDADSQKDGSEQDVDQAETQIFYDNATLQHFFNQTPFATEDFEASDQHQTATHDYE